MNDVDDVSEGSNEPAIILTAYPDSSRQS